MRYETKSNKDSKIRFVLILLIFLGILFSIATRFIAIEADPDVSISKLQGAYVTDEGWKSGNAINKIISNKWLCNDKNDMLLWPVMPLIVYTSFRIFGLSLFSLRLPFVLFSIVLLFLIAITLLYSLREKKSNTFLITILLYVFLAATSYFLFIQGRIAFFDIPMFVFGMFGLIILYHALKETKTKRKYLLFAIHGVSIGICLCVKTTGLIFFISSIVSVLFLKIFNESNNRANIKGLILFFITTIFTLLLILLTTNKIITGSFFSMPLRYIINVETVNNSQFNPLLIMKNYMRFFTNNVLIYNSALFLIMLVSIIIIIQKSIIVRKILLIDLIMLSLTISSFLFLGYFTPQAERYFTILLIPMLYFVPKIFLVMKDYFHSNSNIDINPKSILIVFILIVLSNTWNIWKMGNFLCHRNFTLKNSALSIQKDIEADINEKYVEYTNCMFGMPSSILAAINHLPFVYHQEDNSGNYYITNEPNEFDDSKYTLISQYDIFNFPSSECHIFLLKSRNIQVYNKAKE
ncbi:MAG: glycosyltransferase family 39 protein [Candidatus Cloacimonetes bacterium]|nr:glycosyltransferase family 39 protein [Candidatus Cloacimonadota bacterium]